MPGPILEAEEGDTLVVHFRNRLDVPVTMHPHGVFYRPEMDGAYKGRFTDPGGFVQPRKTFQYVWECREGTAGVWPYHDHGPMDPVPLYKGLFGAIVVRKKGEVAPDAEHFIVFHSLLPVATGLRKPFQCVNGRAYTGNTPTFRAKVGQTVAQHVIGMSSDFHTYHLHGHRWQAPDGRVVDNATIGPADSYSLRFVEDNPGRWFYHCHVFSHLHEGMSGWYVVDP
jgi:FtsP/CotA-like multicopper oxidase with cupredoxin domain